MKVYIATAGSFRWSQIIVDEFVALAQQDKQQRHSLTGDAEIADIILFVDLHQRPGGVLLSLLYQHPLVRRYRDKVFVYDERDRPWLTFPGLYTSVRRSAFDPRRQRSCPYIRLNNSLQEPQNSHPDLLFSFQGAQTHPCREAVLALNHPRALVENTSNFNFFEGLESESAKLAQKRHYTQTVGRSKFVLCPRGHGPSSFRLFETLSIGHVPVIISDEWVAPEGPNWGDCSLLVREADINSIPHLLEEREADFLALSQAAHEIYQEWFSHQVLWNRMMDWCEDLLRNGIVGHKKFYRFDRFYLRAAAEQFKQNMRF